MSVFRNADFKEDHHELLEHPQCLNNPDQSLTVGTVGHVLLAEKSEHAIHKGNRVINEPIDQDQDNPEVSDIITLPNAAEVSAPKVLLKVVEVVIHGPRGAVSTHALLDDGSTVTLICADIADEVGLRGPTVPMRLHSAWDSKLTTADLVTFNVSNKECNPSHKIIARKIKGFKLEVPYRSKVNFVDAFKNYKFCRCDVQPKLLIGQDNCKLLVPLECIKESQGELYLTRTLLGWSVHGRVKESINNLQNTRQVTIQRCIQSLVHACCCKNSSCQAPSCQKMKRVVRHTKLCKRKTAGNCPICKQLITLCCYHAKHCKVTICDVPFCRVIQKKIKLQRVQQNKDLLKKTPATMCNNNLSSSVTMNDNFSGPHIEQNTSLLPTTTPESNIRQPSGIQ